MILLQINIFIIIFMASCTDVSIPIVTILNNIMKTYKLYKSENDMNEFWSLCRQYNKKYPSEFKDICHKNEEFRTLVLENELHYIVDGVLYDECGDLLSSEYPNKIFHVEESDGMYEHDCMVIWRGAFTCKADVIIDSIVVTA